MTPDDTRTSPPDPTRTAGDGTRTGAAVHGSDTRPAGSGSVSTSSDAPPGFVIEREIGRGGMGVVYLARQVGLNRPVALKLIQSGDTGSVLRFLAEAEAMAAVRHPNVAEVYQFGEHAGRPFLALEFCPGGDLTRLVSPTRERGPDWFRARADLMVKVAEGVAAAHAAGIVHRDLKPHNVLLTANGTPKVTDFGLAKREGGSDLTKTNAIMGTPAYMPPEQAKGETKFAGPQADVWALGVMLYEALTGTRPFAGADHWAVLAAVQRGAFAAPRSLVLDIPRDLELVCLKCLKADPQDRYPTAAELAADLRNWLAGRPISARPAGVVERAVKWARRNKTLAGMGLAVLVTMGVATGVSLGFGLDANDQRKIADGQTVEAKREKQMAVDARTEVERMLAKALLGPVSSTGHRDWLSEYERDAVWQLAEIRDGPVGMLFLEEATRTLRAVRQFECRAEYLDHAVVGLDSNRRQAADALYAARLRNPDGIPEQTRDLALGVLDAERFNLSVPVSSQLITALDGKLDRKVWLKMHPQTVWEKLDPDSDPRLGLAAVATDEGAHRSRLMTGVLVAVERMPPTEGATALGEAAESLLALLKRMGERRQRYTETFGLSEVGGWLARVAAKLPPERMTAVCEAAAGHLGAALAVATDTDELEELSQALASVVKVLPTEQAARLCSRIADALERGSKAEPAGNKRHEMVTWLRLLPACLRSPAERVSELLSQADGRTVTTWAAFRADLLTSLQNLPVDTPQGTSSRLAKEFLTRLKAATDGGELRGWAEALAAIAGRLPPATATDHCRAAVEALTVALGKENSPSQLAELTFGVLALAERLPAAETALACQKAADALKTGVRSPSGFGDEHLLMSAVRAVAERMPADAATAFLAAMMKVERVGQKDTLAAAMAVACRRLPDDLAAELCEKAAVTLTDVPTAYEGGQLATGFAAMAARIPPTRAAEICSKVADRLLDSLADPRYLHRLHWPAVALAAVAAVLPHEQAVTRCRRAADTLLDILRTDNPKFYAHDRADIAVGVGAVCACLPAETALPRLLEAMELATGWSDTTSLGALACGLSGPERHRFRTATELGSLCGVTVLQPTALPKPRPLPPQQLVDLLKHPFCVKEARRVVLDALEFTYDRRFTDLWEFVSFAEKEHPELDLLTPPKRPEKK